MQNPEIPEPVLLILADISGYTRYMTANSKTLAHSQIIITELIKSIIKQVELPLEVAKLEGDAVFLYCRKQKSTKSWRETRRIIGEKLLTFFRMFGEKVLELSRSNTCSCNACTHIERLRLKLVVHSGEALFHQVLHFVELAGVDVIIVHRLLKNSVTSNQYLLMTEAAKQDVEFPEPMHLTPGVETYEDIGKIKTLIFLPDAASAAAHQPRPASFATRFARRWRLSTLLLLAPCMTAAQNKRYHNVASNATSLGRIAYATITLVLLPLLLPVSSFFALCKAIHNSESHPVPAADHKV